MANASARGRHGTVGAELRDGGRSLSEDCQAGQNSAMPMHRTVDTPIGMGHTARASSSNSEIKFMPRQPMAFLPRDGHRRGESFGFTLPQIERPPSISLSAE
jgi:hypothetical protein